MVRTETLKPARTKEPNPSRAANPGRVLQILQERIEQRTYPAGGWLPTERELAQELDVNRSAVRDALLRLEHAGLIERRPGCRPTVSGAPRSSIITAPRVRSSSRVIAVALPQHQEDHASREIMRGVAKVLRSGDVHYRQLVFDIVMNTREPYIMEQEVCEALETGEAAGAIVWPTLHPEALAHWRKLRDDGYPIVFVDRFDRTMSCDFVGVDKYTAARDAVEYLLERGHTRIAHLTSSEPVPVVRERAAGYRDAMDAAGLPEQTLWTVRHGHMSETGTVIQSGIDADGWPTAVFAVNDHSAYRCIDYFQSIGIRVPEDVSVVGFDDVDRFSPRPGHLTSVRQPFERIGQRAAEMLLNRLSATTQTPEPYQEILLPTRLIERESCRSIT
jgi:LacI family transcriptional regulator